MFFYACARVLPDYFGEPRQFSWCSDWVIGWTMRNSATNPGKRKEFFISSRVSIPVLESVQLYRQREKMALVWR